MRLSTIIISSLCRYKYIKLNTKEPVVDSSRYGYPRVVYELVPRLCGSCSKQRAATYVAYYLLLSVVLLHILIEYCIKGRVHVSRFFTVGDEPDLLFQHEQSAGKSTTNPQRPMRIKCCKVWRRHRGAKENAVNKHMLTCCNSQLKGGGFSKLS